MLCGESLRKGRDTVLGCNSTTAKIFLSITMGLLWTASCIYSIWGLRVLTNDYLKDINKFDGKDDIKTAGGFYIVFQAFSAVAWGCVSMLTRKRMTSYSSFNLSEDPIQIVQDRNF
jgi:hypothetical protein